MGNNNMRADIYAQLSEFFKEPTEEFADDVASGRLLRYFKKAFSELEIDVSVLSGLSVNNDVLRYNLTKPHKSPSPSSPPLKGGELIQPSPLAGEGALLVNSLVYASLKDEYRRLFLGPMPPYIVPVESVYKKWTNDPGCKLSMSGEKGYLMGDPAMDMINRYRASEIVIPDKYSSMPDHLSLELEYMSFLCSNASKREQQEFLLKHLDWIDSLLEDCKNHRKGFYSTAIKITAFLTSHFLTVRA
ncbi:MAG: hypothetical protein EPN22_03865 [Nitrospirae bacterium]|nr:MAG: hypothetical protein EPN22_03865 [Nitrospirota bacterium]